jgi:hemerythrin
MDNKESELVTWSSTFSVGIKLIDDQHKGLLDLVNDMFNHVCGSIAEEEAYSAAIIQKTVNYIRVHFSTEEKIISHTNFPGYAEHKSAHDDFILTVVDYIKNFDTDKNFVLTEFTRFLKEWILTHIAIMDKQYFAYFKQIAIQKADGKLYIDQSDDYSLELNIGIK